MTQPLSSCCKAEVEKDDGKGIYSPTTGSLTCTKCRKYCSYVVTPQKEHDKSCGSHPDSKHWHQPCSCAASQNSYLDARTPEEKQEDVEITSETKATAPQTRCCIQYPYCLHFSHTPPSVNDKTIKFLYETRPADRGVENSKND